MKKFLTFATILLVLSEFTVLAALLEGTIEKIDLGKKQILLHTEKGKESVEFTNSTKGVDTMKAGDKVKINYTEKGGNFVADMIDASKSSASSFPSERPAAPSGLRVESSPGVR